MTDIVLSVDATAEPNTCGSCKFFKRRDGGDWYGFCQIKLPPAKEYYVERKLSNDDEFQPANFLRDNSSCDFWRSDGKQYIVQRRVGK